MTRIVGRARLTALTVIAVLAAVACGGGSPSAKPQPTRQDSRRAPVALEITVTGAKEFTFKESGFLRINTITSDNPGARFLSVGMEEFKPVDGGVFRAAFDLVGSYTGPGTYEIGGESATSTTVAATGASASLSNAFVLVLPLFKPDLGMASGNIDQVNAKEFKRQLAPCAIKVGKGEKSGELSCPKMAVAGSDESVTFRMRWEDRE
jgi:hypothetical protein